MKSVLISILITSCSSVNGIFSSKMIGSSGKLILEGRGVSMTRTHLESDEVLKDIRKVNAKFCLGNVSSYAGVGAVDLVVYRAQKAYKADFIREFRVTEIMENAKTCYVLVGVASKAVKR